MPQTLLSLAALVVAAFFTLGQKQASTRTMESIVTDEFELAVAGSLLNTTEYADSRAFDEASTPEALRVRLGLPRVLTQTVLDTLTTGDVTLPTSAFRQATGFGLDPAGRPTLCNPKLQSASVNCNDVSDLHERASGWRDVTLTAPNGDPLPVEVHVEVHYVNSNAPDVNVAGPTYHKRVDVWARSPLLLRRFPGHEIRMRRVISFDPVVALEYLRRTSCVISDATAAEVARLEAAVRTAQRNAEQAHRSADTAAQAATAAEATATQRAQEAATAEASATQAQQTSTQAAATLAAEQQTLANFQRDYNQSNNALYRWWLQAYYITPQLQTVQNAQTAATTARNTATTAQSRATSARTTATTAERAASSARLTATAAAAAAAAADQAVVTATAALQTLTGGCR